MSARFVDAVYDGAVGRGWSSTARLAYDYYGYRGDYPYDYGEDGIALSEDGSDVHTMTGELTARRRFARRHLFTAGVEVRNQIHSHQWVRDIYGESLNVNVPGTNVGVYAQDEVRIFPWLLGNFGLRVDRFDAFGVHAAPRAGLVLLPRDQTAIKLLYGRAFRAPNAYELYYSRTARRRTPARPGGDPVNGDRVGGIALEAHPDGGDGLCLRRRPDHHTAACRRRHSRRYLLRQRGRHPRYRDRSRSGDQVPEWHCRTLQSDLRTGGGPDHGRGDVQLAPSPVEVWRSDSRVTPVPVGRRSVRRRTADARRRDARRVLHTEYHADVAA